MTNNKNLNTMWKENKQPLTETDSCIMNNDEFLKWWNEQAKIIERNMEVFDREQRLKVAQAFEDLSKVILTM